VIKDNRISQMRMADSSPEKAGVGGSIPSLATMFSVTYYHPKLTARNTNGARRSPQYYIVVRHKG
jgi:hypothetical protein